MNKGPSNSPNNMGRRNFLKVVGGATAAIGSMTGVEALSQTVALEAKKKEMAGTDALVIEFGKLSLSQIVKKANTNDIVQSTNISNKNLAASGLMKPSKIITDEDARHIIEKESGRIARLETEQQQLLQDLVANFKNVLQDIEELKGKKPTPTEYKRIDNGFGAYVLPLIEKLVENESNGIGINGSLIQLGVSQEAKSLMERRKAILDRIVNPIKETRLYRLFEQ